MEKLSIVKAHLGKLMSIILMVAVSLSVRLRLRNKSIGNGYQS